MEVEKSIVSIQRLNLENQIRERKGNEEKIKIWNFGIYSNDTIWRFADECTGF